MYRYLILLALLYSCKTKSPADESRLIGKWKSGKYEILINDLSGKSSNTLNYNLLFNCTIRHISDTLIFTSAENDPVLRISYKCLILKNTDSSLVLKPVNASSKTLLEKDTVVSFIKESYLLSKPFHFSRMIFHAGICFGNCPITDVQVDSSRHIEYSINKTNYTATMPEADYNELLKRLKLANLDRYTYIASECCDGSIETFIVYYNGHRKYIKTMFPPAPFDSIGLYFDLAPKKIKMEKTSASFNIER